MKSEIPVTVPDRFDAADVLGAPQPARVADPSTLANPADRLSTHDNGFGLLRLLFATMVLWDHAFPLGGFGADPMWRLTLNQDSMGGICVSGFFAISGFLIAKSGMRADALQFAWRRCVRIFPAYWAVLIVTALCVGPIIHYVQAGTLHGYWNTALGGPLGYITNNWRLTIRTIWNQRSAARHDTLWAFDFGERVQRLDLDIDIRGEMLCDGRSFCDVRTSYGAPQGVACRDGCRMVRTRDPDYQSGILRSTPPVGGRSPSRSIRNDFPDWIECRSVFEESADFRQTGSVCCRRLSDFVV